MDSEWFIQLKIISSGIRSPSSTVLKPVRRNKFLRRYKFGYRLGSDESSLKRLRIILWDVKSNNNITNSEYTTSYVSIYEIEPRFHMTLESTFGPTTLWKQGIEDMYGGTVNPQTGVYNVPFESPMFVHFYKVNKIIKFALGSGQSHEHVSTYHHNKKLFGAIPGVYEIVHGMTNMQMIVVSGTPINDSTNKALVSTSTCALAIVRRSTRNFTYAPQNRARYQYTETLGTISSANVVTDTTIKLDSDA